MPTSRATSYRIDPSINARLEADAAAEHITERALLEQLVAEGLAVLCVLTSRLPPQGMHVHLAELLDKWALAHPEPYRGLHRPR